MEAVKEITGGLFPPHIYLLDGNNLVAYIKQNTKAPFYFNRPIKGFDKRGRKFEKVSNDLFNISFNVFTPNNIKEVSGSKGQTYIVNLDENTCSCPGYTFRGTCKHVKELEAV